MSFTTLIDAHTLAGLIGNPQVALIDCRFELAAPAAGRRAYEAAHIPGAHYADLNLDLSGPVTAASGRHPLPQPAVLAARLSTFGIGEHTQVIAYDEANGSFAARAWWLLRWLGHAQAAVLDGGFKAWVAYGGAVQSGEPNPASDSPTLASAAHFAPLVDSQAVVTTAELAGARNPADLLVDARAPERYAGSVEPLDPVAGHVPGAVNHPFSTNLGADGRFLPAAELRRHWLTRLAGTDPRHLIAMCGSGVTACHNLLALEIAGLPGARLYAGSWSEWIRDPGRAVARGPEP